MVTTIISLVIAGSAVAAWLGTWRKLRLERKSQRIRERHLVGVLRRSQRLLLWQEAGRKRAERRSEASVMLR